MSKYRTVGVIRAFFQVRFFGYWRQSILLWFIASGELKLKPKSEFYVHILISKQQKIQFFIIGFFYLLI